MIASISLFFSPCPSSAPYEAIIMAYITFCAHTYKRGTFYFHYRETIYARTAQVLFFFAMDVSLAKYVIDAIAQFAFRL